MMHLLPIMPESMECWVQLGFNEIVDMLFVLDSDGNKVTDLNPVEVIAG